MSLIFYDKALHLHVYDTKATNLTRLHKEFHHLAVDPYVKQGFRQKHILHLKQNKKEFEQINTNVLFQDSKTNPVHGGIHRVYPNIESWNTERNTVCNLLHLFTDLAKVQHNKKILLQFQRITCEHNKPGQPSVENWHRDNVDMIAVLCLARNNVAGGINQFKNETECTQLILQPYEMVVFDDSDVMHRVTEIVSKDGVASGYRDVILIASY